MTRVWIPERDRLKFHSGDPPSFRLVSTHPVRPPVSVRRDRTWSSSPGSSLCVDVYTEGSLETLIPLISSGSSFTLTISWSDFLLLIDP